MVIWTWSVQSADRRLRGANAFIINTKFSMWLGFSLMSEWKLLSCLEDRWTPGGLICGSTEDSQCHLHWFIYGSSPVPMCSWWKVLSGPHLPPQQLPYMEIHPPAQDTCELRYVTLSLPSTSSVLRVLHAQGFWNLTHQDLSQYPVIRGRYGDANQPICLLPSSLTSLWSTSYRWVLEAGY